MPRSMVFNRIAKNRGYGLPEEEEDPGNPTPDTSIAREGAEPYDIIPGASPPTESEGGASAGDYSNDPMMQRFNQDQAQLADVRNTQGKVNANSNFIQAISQIAQGVNTPRDNSGLYANMNTQNQEMGRSLAQDVGSRSKVMEAIAKRKQTESQNSLSNELKRSRLGLDTEKAQNTKTSRDALTEAYNKRTGVIGANAGTRLDNQAIRTAQSLSSDPNMRKEVTKLNTARSAQALVQAIRNGELKDSGNISKQLTNMIATIEMGTPGGVGDRQTMGVDTLYSRLKDTLGFVSGNPQSRIPEQYLNQLESEVHALGNRAAKNYKSMSDASLQGADLSGGSAGVDKGKVYGLAQQRQAEMLRANGYDPSTGDPINKAPVEEFIMFKDPQGNIRKVRASQKEAALKAGGTLVQ